MNFRLVAPLVLAVATLASAGETTASWGEFSRERAARLERQGMFEDAMEEWLVLARLVPDDPRPYSRVAVLAVETPVMRDTELAPGTPFYSTAERCVRDYITRWGERDPAIAYVIGRLRYADKQWGTAWRMFLEAKDRGFEPSVARFWYYRAAVNRSKPLIDAGRPVDAIKDLQSLRVAMPDHPERAALMINLAAAHHAMQEPEVALGIIKEILAENPDSADAYYLWALILRDKGDLEESEARFMDALRHASATYGDRVYRNTLLRLCEVDIKLEKLDQAEAYAKQYLDVAKDDGEGIFAMGRVKQARGDLDQAVRLFRRAVRLMPDAQDTLLLLKQVLYQLGEKEEADEVGKRIQDLLKRRDADLQGR